MQLYVVRHGETEMGKNKVIATIEEPLNDYGIKQAIDLGLELNCKNIDLIYCSPIQRAQHTLELFELEKNIPVILDERIKERNMGIYENISFDKLNWENFWGIDSEKTYPELESMKNVYKRVSEFLDELREKYNDKSILLVTHGGIARAIYWYFKGFDNSLFKCENCKIYEYNIN